MIELKEDEYYLDTDGNIIKNDFATKLLFVFQSKDKTVAHIPKELHFDIIKTIKAYHSDNETKEYIDYAYKNKGN